MVGSDGDDHVDDRTMGNLPDGVIESGTRRKEKQTLVLLSQKLGYDKDNFDSTVAAKLGGAANFALPDVYKKYNPKEIEWRKLVESKMSHDANDIFKRGLRGMMKGEGFPRPGGDWEKRLTEMDEKPLQRFYRDVRKASQARKKRALTSTTNSPRSINPISVANTNHGSVGPTGGADSLDASGSKRRRISDHVLYAPENVFTRQDRIPFQAPFTTGNNGVVTNLNRTNETTSMATDFGGFERAGMSYLPAWFPPAMPPSPTPISADVNSLCINDFYLPVSEGAFGISQPDLIPFTSGPSTQLPQTQYLPATQRLTFPPNALCVQKQIELDQFASVLPTWTDIPPNTRVDGQLQQSKNPLEKQAHAWSESNSANAVMPTDSANQHNILPTDEGFEPSDTSLTLFHSALGVCISKLDGHPSEAERREAIVEFVLRLLNDKDIADIVCQTCDEELGRRVVALLMTNSEQHFSISPEAQ